MGPMNGMVKRLKWFSLSTLLFTGAAVPVFLYKNDDDRWTPLARTGFLSVVVASSLASTLAFHMVAGKYVFRVSLLATESALSKDSKLAITTVSFWGVEKTLQCKIRDVVRVEKGLCTWRVNGRPFFLAVPKKMSSDTQFSRLVQLVSDD